MELLKFNLRDAVSVRDYILAGNSNFTIKSETSGDHRTYKVKKGSLDILYFVKLLVSENSYMYIGNIVQSTDGSLRFTKGKNVRYNSESMGIKAVEFLMLNINKGMIHPKLHILPSKFCCKCGRTLTTPESLKAGIGPECSKKLKQK